MPYQVVKVEGGWKVRGPRGMMSKAALSKAAAEAQARALYAAERRKGRGKAPIYKGPKPGRKSV